MILKKVELSKLYGINGNATLEAYVHQQRGDMNQKICPALIVVPGGGYGSVSAREAEEVCLKFYTKEYNTFLLTYSIAPEQRYPTQLTQLASAVDYIKKHAQTLFVDATRIFAVGFSAGGHLVGSLLNAEAIPNRNDLDFRLTGGVLSYPVITGRACAHIGSFQNLLGDDYGKNKPEHEWLNLDESVSDTNPPAFIWTTADDNCVPAMNSLLYAAAYAERGLKYELHVFKSGVHGLAMGDESACLGLEHLVNPDVQIWPDYADKFLRSIAQSDKK